MRLTGTFVTDFIRYHVLIRVFGGDVDAWIRLAEKQNDADITFLRWLKGRLRDDHSLLPKIEAEVNGSGLWPSRTDVPG